MKEEVVEEEKEEVGEEEEEVQAARRATPLAGVRPCMAATVHGRERACEGLRGGRCNRTERVSSE